MLDSKKLMLGNALWHIKSERVVYVRGIFTFATFVHPDPKSTNGDWENDENLKPILMTNDWLQPLGFDRKNCIRVFNGPHFFVGPVSEDEWSLELIDEQNKPIVIKIFRYVHELQNLLTEFL